MSRLAVVVGGRSVEHALSVESGRALCHALSRTAGAWDPTLIVIEEDGSFPIREPAPWLQGFDYVLPLVQGAELPAFLSMLEIPLLGESSVGVAAAGDKPLAKRLLQQAGLPTLPSRVFTRRQLATRPREVAMRVAREIGFPCFVKPACGAASVGASPVRDLASLLVALARAASYDARVMVEPCLDAREIEVAVLVGTPSIPGELVFRAEFHDYDTKTRPGALELVIPAMVSGAERDQLQAMAAAAFAALDMEAVARVEFLVDRNTHQFFVNEVNALPNFAPNAVFPRLWEAGGVDAAGVVGRLAAAADARQREIFRTRRSCREAVTVR